MYPNVRAEMGRKGLTILALAKETGIRYQTLAEKLKGKSDLTLAEAKNIKRALETDLSLEELFEEVP